MADGNERRAKIIWTVCHSCSGRADVDLLSRGLLVAEFFLRWFDLWWLLKSAVVLCF